MPLTGGSLPFLGCRLRRSIDTTTVSGVWSIIPFDIVSYDTDNLHTAAPNPSYITIRTAGVYEFGASVRWIDDNVGYRGIAILKNGATVLVFNRIHPTPNAITVQMANTVSEFDEDDYIELWAAQLSGGNLVLESKVDYTPVFWAYRIALPT